MQAILNGFRCLFSATLPAGRVFGIPLRVHVILVLFSAFHAWRSAAGFWDDLGPVLAILLSVGYIAILYGSVLFHELGHAWGCRLVGGQTDHILLWPLGGLHYGSGGRESPKSELIVVILGPAASALLALLGWGIYALMPEPTSEWSWAAWVAAYFFFQINLVLLIFNTVFVMYPMDSGRILRALLSLKFNPQTVTLRVCQWSLALAVACIVGWLFKWSLPFIGGIDFWLMLIALMAIGTCLNEMEAIKHMDVYSRSDDWGRGPVYYDQDLVKGAKAKARADLGRLFGLKWFSKSPRKPKVVGPAKVIDISPQRDPENIADPAELRAMMREAAEREDFKLAARIKRRLREIEKRENA